MLESVAGCHRIYTSNRALWLLRRWTHTSDIKTKNWQPENVGTACWLEALHSARLMRTCVLPDTDPLPLQCCPTLLLLLMLVVSKEQQQ